MDPVTHGIAGALLGKGFFSKREERVAIFAATLGAVFPDVDIVAEIFSRDPLSIIKYHRAITHSFVALPFFAFLLALLTRALVPPLSRGIRSLRDVEAPPLALLTLIYGVGIASHIVLDAMTSFGTRIWYPLSTRRVAWDLLFIIDFSFTTVILVPQLVAWIYSDNQRSRARALRTWLVFSVASVLVWELARAAGYPFRLRIVPLAIVVLAAVFFLPAKGDWGFRVTRARWCQAGAFVALVYLFGCSVAHHVAILRAKAFADQNHIDVTRIGALPIPPSWLDWGDAIRSPDALFETQFDLRTPGAPAFNFIPDSPPDPYIAKAVLLPSVQLYWNFARFPSIHSFQELDGGHVVDFGENRFQNGSRRGPQPFTYEVHFDPSGKLVEEGWLTNGMLQTRMMRMAPGQLAPAAPSKNSQ
jgi:membrane-bound metal-dependent hydrolase YbcI (DUF457 family)